MYYFTVNYSTIYYSTTTPAVCIRKPTCAGSRFTYFFTILLFYYFTILLFSIPVLYKAVCISETDLRRFTVHLLFYYFTILLFYYFTIIPVLYYSTMYYFTVNYSTIYYSTTTPAVCISETDLRRFTVHLLFYYFTILLFYYFSTVQSRLHLGNRPAPVHSSLAILLFYYFSVIPVLYYSTMYYFTVNYSTIYYSTTTPAVCISETDLRRFTVHLLFYYFTILLFYYSGTVQSRLNLGNRPAPVHGSLTILLFYYFTILLLFQYCTILLCTILLLTIPLFTILPRPQPFASRKPTCAGSRFTYYFTILLLFQYCTILLCTNYC